MRTRGWHIAAGLALGAASLACRREPTPQPAATLAAPPVRKPNIVVIVVDTLRRNHLPIYGYERDTAPFLTKLARQGVVFERAHAVSAWTAPCTASLFTSLYPGQHGVTMGLMATRRLQKAAEKVQLNRVPDQLVTLPEAMLSAGYATFALTENPNISSKLGFDEGFQRFRNLPREDTAEALNKRLFNWADGIRRSQPYFLYLHYLDPHQPYYRRAPWFDERTRGEARDVSAYDSEIRYFDSHLEQAYERLGWDKDTLILLTADHGEAFQSDHGFGGHGHSLFAELLDVPLVAVFPDRRYAGQRPTERVSHLDVLPTLAEFAGLTPEPLHAGRSLLPLLDGKQPSPRTLFAHLRRRNPGGAEIELHAVIEGDFKLISGGDRALLFDLAKDPLEKHNLARQQPERVVELEARWAAFERHAPRFVGEQRETVLDAGAREELKALGYVQ